MLKFIKGNRYKFAPVCPCGKDNRDGKFSPLEGGGGNCFACRTFFPPETLRDKNVPRYQPEVKRIESAFQWADVAYSVNRLLDAPMKCNLIAYLTDILGEAPVAELIEKYIIGMDKEGGAVFWFIDTHNRIRAGKRILYQRNGKRDRKAPFSIKYISPRYEKQPLCLFGLHSLSTMQNKPVCVVESEKTALIASVLIPSFVWLACGGKAMLNLEKIEEIGVGKTLLFPDDDGVNAWMEIAHEVRSKNLSIQVFTPNEAAALLNVECKTKEDLADVLLRYCLSSDR